MSREIKFRVWDKRDKRHFYLLGLIKDGSEIRIWWKLSDEVVMNKSFNESFIVIEQYTGLKDIYEHDIVKSFHYENMGEKHYIYHVVVWNHKYSCWMAISKRNFENENLESGNGNVMLWILAKQDDFIGKCGNIHQTNNDNS